MPARVARAWISGSRKESCCCANRIRYSILAADSFSVGLFLVFRGVVLAQIAGLSIAGGGVVRFRFF